jgi:hypothetical protein
MAKIGETYAQVKTEAQHDKDTVVMRVSNFYGRTMLRVQYRNGDAIRHLFGSNGREIAFYWFADHAVTNREIGIIMRMFRTRWHAVQPTATDTRFAKWESESGLAMLVENNYLSIFDLSRISEVPKGDVSEQQQGAENAPATPEDKNDCLIVATEAYARLKKTSSWARIVAFRLSKNGKSIGGHAVVVYQPTSSSNVFMYDQTLGSIDLRTQSHELAVIMPIVNRVSRDFNGYSSDNARWIGADENQSSSSQAEVVSPDDDSTSDSQTQTVTSYQAGYLLGFAMMLALFASTAVICFLKGKPVFGTLGILALFFGGFSLWAVIGACRIAKPHSWWARRNYGAGKMNIAVQRFVLSG